METPKNDAQAIIDTMTILNLATFHTVQNGTSEEMQVCVIPKGKEIVSIKQFFDEYRTRPERRRGTATLTTLESFIAHVKRHRDDASVVFSDTADRKAPKLIAVYDYNEAGGDVTKARFGEHRAVYHFPISEEWTAWTSRTQAMQQDAFAEFLEERIVDVIDPATVGETVKRFAAELGITLAAPQRLMELSRGLAVRVGQRVVQQVNLSSGEAQLGFEEKHEGESGPLKVPGGFAIGVPVFRSGALYQVPARLRYRVHGGAVSWMLSLQRVDQVWDHAITEACDLTAKETGCPLFYGTPEK